MKVLVFGGTTEGRLLARELSALGAQVTVSVATALGAEELPGRAAADGVRRPKGRAAGCVKCCRALQCAWTPRILTRPRPAGTSARRALRPGCRTGGCCAGPAPCRRTALSCPTRRPPRGGWPARQGNILLATGSEGACRLCGRWTRSGCTRGCCPRTRGLRPARRLGVPRRQYHCAAGAFYAGAERGADAPVLTSGTLVTKDGGAHREDSAKRRRRRGMWARGSWWIRRPADSGEA